MEIYQGVDVRVASSGAWVSLNVSYSLGFLRWKKTSEVELDERLLHRHKTKRFEVSKTKDVDFDLKLFVFDLFS